MSPKKKTTAKVPVIGDAWALMLADAARSALTEEDVKILQYTDLDKKQAMVAGGGTGKSHGRVGFKIPYFDGAGAKTDFYRIRFLPTDPPPKYVQPPGVAPELYLPPPPYVDRPWSEILKDTTIPRAIVEGEKKAVAVCKHAGIACLGLGGVDSFQSTRHGWSLLPVLADAEWEDCTTYVIFDADSHAKPGVLRARERLAAELMKRKADVRIVTLPADGPKAIDDVIKAALDAGEDPKAVVQALLDSATSPTEARLAVYLRTRVLITEGRETLVADLTVPGKHRILSLNAALNLGDNDRVPVPVGKTIKSQPLIQLWKGHPDRITACGRIWVPREETLIEERTRLADGTEHVARYVNEYQRKYHDLSLARDDLLRIYLEQLEYMYGEDAWIVICYHAHRMQFPGERPPIAVLSIARQHGTGRGWHEEVLAALLGHWNVRKVNARDLTNTFNEFKSRSVHVYCEEVWDQGSKTKWEMGAELRDFVTATRDEINAKYGLKGQQNIYAGVSLGTNHPYALKITIEDRRLAVLEVTNPLRGSEHWTELYRLLGLGRGTSGQDVRVGEADPAFLASVAKFLLKLDLRQPYREGVPAFLDITRAPETKARAALIEAGATDVESAVLELIETCPAKVIVPSTVNTYLRIRGIAVHDPKIDGQVKALLRDHAFRPFKLGDAKRSPRVRVPTPTGSVLEGAPIGAKCRPREDTNKEAPWILKSEDRGLSLAKLQQEADAAGEWVEATREREEKELQEAERQERRTRRVVRRVAAAGEEDAA